MRVVFSLLLAFLALLSLAAATEDVDQAPASEEDDVVEDRRRRAKKAFKKMIKDLKGKLAKGLIKKMKKTKDKNGDWCNALCKEDASNDDCKQCCIKVNHRVDWFCDEPENPQQAACCTNWTAECYTIANDNNNNHACSECGGYGRGYGGYGRGYGGYGRGRRLEEGEEGEEGGYGRGYGGYGRGRRMEEGEEGGYGRGYGGYGRGRRMEEGEEGGYGRGYGGYGRGRRMEEGEEAEEGGYGRGYGGYGRGRRMEEGEEGEERGYGYSRGYGGYGRGRRMESWGGYNSLQG